MLAGGPTISERGYVLVTATAVCVYTPLAVPTWATGLPTSLVVHCTTTCLHVPTQPAPQPSCMALPATMVSALLDAMKMSELHMLVSDQPPAEFAHAA